MNKLTKISNIFISIFLLLVLMVGCVHLWHYSILFARANVTPITHLISNQAETSYSRNMDENLSIMSKNEGMYLYDESGNIICGPYPYIFDDDSSYGLLRYIDANGLIGYLSKKDGSILLPAQFTQASMMSNGAALVSTGDGYIYYISPQGERITEGIYIDGGTFHESQGCYARVQFEDGSWGIIDKGENIIASGFDYIGHLPCVTTIGSATRNGKTVLYNLPHNEGYEFVEIKEYENVSEFDICLNRFAIIKYQNGLYGVADVWDGNIIVDSQYTQINWTIMTDETTQDEIVIFICQNQNGTYEVITWKN